ncbi:unnamed protein product [Vitrella brassicaformis CCMP3155]|uniref:t-SNARE coiled-coil homology domain-containing protein n=1 Tax=Vitrella brassicaformis (strain CCMP3155) TaxID=1169540 RepID=A0A0G4GHI4_VITBC|nr:unnamed protein product [Vitrella brassicaformis CCMP3155]|eukprot:CEM29187.1 unnamed protein product [Vitrella brassicaformis CCMP3155]
MSSFPSDSPRTRSISAGAPLPPLEHGDVKDASGESAVPVDSIAAFERGVESLRKAIEEVEQLTRQVGTKRDTDGFRKHLQQSRDECRRRCRLAHSAFRSLQPNVREKSKAKAACRSYTRLLRRYDRLWRGSVHKEEREIRRLSHSSSILSRSSRSGSILSSFVSGGASAAATGAGGSLQSIRVEDSDSLQVSVLRWRHEELSRLQEDMQDLKQLFRDVEMLVQSQQAGLDMAEHHLAPASAEVERGHTALIMGDQYRRSRRRRCGCFICMGILLILVGLCVAVILALKYTHRSQG